MKYRVFVPVQCYALVEVDEVDKETAFEVAQERMYWGETRPEIDTSEWEILPVDNPEDHVYEDD